MVTFGLTWPGYKPLLADLPLCLFDPTLPNMNSARRPAPGVSPSPAPVAPDTPDGPAVIPALASHRRGPRAERALLPALAQSAHLARALRFPSA